MVMPIERKRSGNPKNKKKDRTGLYVILIILVVVVGSISIYASVINKNLQNGDHRGDAPDFTLTALDGSTFTLSDHLGKIVIIDFMYVNCYPCQLEMAELKHVYEQFSDDLVIISISVWWAEDKADELQKFKDSYQAEWIFALDTTDEDTTMKYNAFSVPKIVVIDKTGNVVYTSQGGVSRQVLTKEINKISNIGV